ncbi:hypothetical protein LUZ63_003878 [Rhynchospora breviuscula]|uniref:Uncharacterized protein n=1 Tax=Rhynchospora breviuscula TaxID=2022672 RepID=A0A9Q0HZ48_9POAL|nr:hypothetical protein LUZ63_003878 [Rhynchospora breviuscula]
MSVEEAFKDAFESRNSSKKIWTVGFGDGSGMLGSIQRITEKALNQMFHFDHTIRISIPSLIDSSGGTNDIDQIEKNAVLAVANALDLINERNSKVWSLKNEVDDEIYYNYRPYNKFLGFDMIRELKKQIYEKLLGKRCLIIVEYLLQSLNDPINTWLMEGWLPLPVAVSDLSSWWLISTPSREVSEQSKGTLDIVVDIGHGEIAITNYWGMNYNDWIRGLILEILLIELQRLGRSVSSKIACREVTEGISWSCLLYTLLLNGDSIITQKHNQNENPVENCIGAKELIRFWISEGLFTRTIKLNLDRRIFQLEKEEKENRITITSTDELFELANTILETLLPSSLLQIQSCHPCAPRPLPSPNSCIRPFSGMWELLHKKNHDISFNRVGLLTENDLSDPSELANRNWISFATDSCKWIELIGNTNYKTTTLILRGRKEISQPTIEALIFHMPCLRVLDLSYTSIKSLPLSIASLANLRLLSLKLCQNITSLTPDLSTSSPISTLQRLEVLDLHGVPLTEISNDLGHKKSRIYYLDLSCPTITTLPFNIFSEMESLRELVFLGCKYLTSLPISIVSLAKLETLSVSETKLTHLPPDTFKKMICLRVLKLTNNNLLKELPKSLCEAQNLEEIELNGCRSLIAIDELPIKKLKVVKLIDNNLLEELPKSLCEAQNLEEIELNGCWSLIAIDSFPIKKLKVIKLIGNDHMVQLPESLSRSHNLQKLIVSNCQSLTEIKIIGHASLKSFSLSHSPTSSLSLRGCRELENVVFLELDKLEELDLSGTAIKEFPPGIPGLRRLRKLDLGAASHLKRVPWHELDHVPEVFHLDQCERISTTNCNSDSHIEINSGVGVCISVRDSRLFYKLDEETCRLLVAGGSLQSFYILVSSCEKRKEKIRRPSRSIQPQTGATCIYKDADYFKSLIPMPPSAPQPRHRHVEISSTEKYPESLNGILGITESLSVKDNDHLEHLFYLHYFKFSRLKDAVVERCQQMEAIFYSREDVASELLNLRAGHLPQLSVLFKEYYQYQKSLVALKQLHVYNCGKLERIFPDRLLLPNLETLKITCCDMLQTVFYKSEKKPDYTENRLQHLCKIRFEELPQIRHIYEEQILVGPLRAPQWKSLYFRGCWSLRQLPLLEGPRDQQVRVDGEVSQCKKIQMQMKAEELSHYEFKSPPPVASLKNCVSNRIFLK